MCGTSWDYTDPWARSFNSTLSEKKSLKSIQWRNDVFDSDYKMMMSTLAANRKWVVRGQK